MAAKLTIDTANKLFILNAGVTTLDIEKELYSDVKKDWLNSASLTDFRFPIKTFGGFSIGDGKTASPYFQLLNGWKVRPDEANHQLSLTNGNLITDDDTDPFVNTVGSFNVRIKYIVSSDVIVTPTPASEGALKLSEYLALK